MDKKKSNRILLTAFLLMVAVFAVVAVMTAKSTYNEKVAAEKITEPDFNAMTEFAGENSEAVMKALKSESAEKLLGAKEGTMDFVRKLINREA